MSAQTTQIRVTLPIQLEEILLAKASHFGLSLAAYIKHLLIVEAKDKEDIRYPEYEPSERSILALRDALRDEKEGKLIPVDDVDEFFTSLKSSS